MKTEHSSEVAAKYLLVGVNGQVFAIPSTYVVEISPSSKPTKLPFVPRYISGLVNVKGNVISLLDLSTYIYEGDPLPCKQVFVIILSQDTHFALAVDMAIDEVSSTDVKVTNYEPKKLDDDTAEYVRVSGEINLTGKKAFILDMLQFEKIIPAVNEGKDRAGLLGKLHQQVTHEEVISLLVFQTLGERFGFGLDEVTEITETDAPVPITGAPDCVCGMAMLRDDAVLVLSFAALLGRTSHNNAEKRLLIVIEREKSLYGIDISSVVSIETFLKNRLKKSRNEKSLFSNILIDEQERVTTLIKSDELIPAELHKKLKQLAPNVSSANAEVIQYRRLLQITLNNLSYAFPLDDVRLVSPYKTMTTVNDSAKHVRGVIEIEGRIISVIDTSHHLGSVNLAKTHPQYVVIGDESVEWAVPVTQINQIIDIPVTDIEHIASDDLKHFSGMAHHQGQLLPVVNLKELYTNL